MPDLPKSFRKFKKVPFAISVVFLILSGLLFFLVFQKIDENKMSAREAEHAWQQEEARRLEIRSLDILLREAQADRTELDSHFARSSNVVPLLDSIEELARNVGADPEVVAVESPPGGKELFVIVRADGSFEAIYKFLELLENSPYELELITADIGRQGSADAVSGWQASFKMKLLGFIP